MDAATVFVGWAWGCLVWQLVIRLRCPVVFGAAWVIRVFVIVLAALALASTVISGWVTVRDVGSIVLLVTTVVALAWSIVEHRAFRSTRDALIAHGAVDAEGRRVDAQGERAGDAAVGAPVDAPTPRADRLDVVAGIAGGVALLAGIVDAGGPMVLALARGVIGAAALGGLTFTMVFGHRLLAKPYLGRGPLETATNWLLVGWPLELAVMLVPTGMVSVLTGAIDDGYSGILGWMWVMSVATTGGLLVVAKVILDDREHAKPASAVGMLYLAGLTGCVAVLVSRAVLSP